MLFRSKCLISILAAVFIYCAMTTPVFAQNGTLQQNVKMLVAKADQSLRHESQKHLAVDYINRAIKLQPLNLGLHYKRAFIFGRLNLYHEAIRSLNFVIANDPNRRKFPSALKYRAECYAAIGDYARAVSDYHKMLSRGRGDGKIWYYFAELLWFLGDHGQALGAIDRGLMTDSHWKGKLLKLREKILTGKKAQLHIPFSN